MRRFHLLILGGVMWAASARADVLPVTPTADAVAMIAAAKDGIVVDITMRDPACPPCAPHDAAMNEEFAGSHGGIAVLDLAADSSGVEAAMGKLGVTIDSYPTLLFVYRGRVLGQLTAGDSRELTIRWLEAMRNEILGMRWVKRTPAACGASIYTHLIVTKKLLPHDLRNAWLQRADDYIPAKGDAPVGKLTQAQVHAKLVPAFQAVDVYAGPSNVTLFSPMLLRGDLVVYDNVWDRNHDYNGVFVVENYDPTTVTVYGHRWVDGNEELVTPFSLSPDPLTSKRRLLMPMLTVLRPLDTPLCDGVL